MTILKKTLELLLPNKPFTIKVKILFTKFAHIVINFKIINFKTKITLK